MKGKGLKSRSIMVNKMDQKKKEQLIKNKIFE